MLGFSHKVISHFTFCGCNIVSVYPPRNPNHCQTYS